MSEFAPGVITVKRVALKQAGMILSGFNVTEASSGHGHRGPPTDGLLLTLDLAINSDEGEGV